MHFMGNLGIDSKTNSVSSQCCQCCKLATLPSLAGLSGKRHRNFIYL